MDSIKVNFYLDKTRKNSIGLSPIRVRSKHNSSKLIVKATGLFCRSDHWVNTKSKLVSDVVQEGKLMALKNDIITTYADLTKEGRQGITLQDVWNRLYPESEIKDVPKSDLVVDWIDYYITNSPYSREYLRGANQLKVHLTGASKKGKVKAFNPGLRFADLNQTTINSIANHMVKQGLSTSSIVKVIKFLKQVAKMAHDNKVLVGSMDFKAPRNYKKKFRTEVRLSFIELMKLQKVELTEVSHQIIRDQFLFLAFTGMRHGDMLRLTPAEYQGDFLLYTQQKTGEQVAVTLHKYSKPIVKKYMQGKQETELLFPNYTQQFLNREIKPIAKKAGLTDLFKVTSYSGANEKTVDIHKYDLIKTHTGRRSFSRLLSMLLVSEELIAEEMGHGGKTITRHYIGNSDHMARIKTVQKAWSKAEAVLNTKALMRLAS